MDPSSNLIFGGLLGLIGILLSVCAFFLNETWKRMQRLEDSDRQQDERLVVLETLNKMDRRQGDRRDGAS